MARKEADNELSPGGMAVEQKRVFRQGKIGLIGRNEANHEIIRGDVLAEETAITAVAAARVAEACIVKHRDDQGNGMLFGEIRPAVEEYLCGLLGSFILAPCAMGNHEDITHRAVGVIVEMIALWGRDKSSLGL